jgi:hypothetical protein
LASLDLLGTDLLLALLPTAMLFLLSLTAQPLWWLIAW